MSASLIKGRPLAQHIEDKARQHADALPRKRKPHLAVFLVGDDAPSKTYVEKKGQAAKRIGIGFEMHHLSTHITTEKLIGQIENIQKKGRATGLIVQLPLPEHLDTHAVLNAIDPAIDVDCLTDINVGKLMMGRSPLLPPTPAAILSCLASCDVTDLAGKKVTVVGTGPLVGRPLAVMLMQRGATVTTCNSKTINLKKECKGADIVITATGKKDLITGDMIKKNAIVIDAGVSFFRGKMYGDSEIESVLRSASAVTPTPGGVGPLTVAHLLMNTVICAEMKSNTRKKRRGFFSS